MNTNFKYFYRNKNEKTPGYAYKQQSKGNMANNKAVCKYPYSSTPNAISIDYSYSVNMSVFPPLQGSLHTTLNVGAHSGGLFVQTDESHFHLIKQG